jgi:murein DD-endopeptidase MepM/ murein hydrolase activator NlpD
VSARRVAVVAGLLGCALVAPVVVAATVSTAPAAATQYLRTFPIQGTPSQPYTTTAYPYVDQYGTPGPEGPIVGIDLPAAAGTPVVAVCNATVVAMNSQIPTGLGGIWVRLQDVTGTQYYYAHLSAVAPGLAVGSQLVTGQVIGAVGTSGDALGGNPLLYFEIDPRGATPADPYGDLHLLAPAPPTVP